MKAEFTPGPWKIKNKTDIWANDIFVGTLHDKCFCVSDYDSSHFCYDLERMENAKLVCAAQDLLEACQIVLDNINLHHKFTHLRKVLEPAIAKATE